MLPEPVVASEAGNLLEGEKKAASIVEETYLNSYVAHAPMEPHAALASVDGDKATVWASTQTPFGVQRLVAQTLGLPRKMFASSRPFVGGGFGGKSASAQAVEAARLCQTLRQTRHGVWTREEEFFFDTFRPAAVVKIRSGIDNALAHVVLGLPRVFCRFPGLPKFLRHSPPS
jgi:nicotinate dehydrogenase subunit B